MLTVLMIGQSTSVSSMVSGMSKTKPVTPSVAVSLPPLPNKPQRHAMPRSWKPSLVRVSSLTFKTIFVMSMVAPQMLLLSKHNSWKTSKQTRFASLLTRLSCWLRFMVRASVRLLSKQRKSLFPLLRQYLVKWVKPLSEWQNKTALQSRLFLLTPVTSCLTLMEHLLMTVWVWLSRSMSPSTRLLKVKKKASTAR